jgi:hypothetical protein
MNIENCIHCSKPTTDKYHRNMGLKSCNECYLDRLFLQNFYSDQYIIELFLFHLNPVEKYKDYVDAQLDKLMHGSPNTEVYERLNYVYQYSTYTTHNLPNYKHYIVVRKCEKCFIDTHNYLVDGECVTMCYSCMGISNQVSKIERCEQCMNIKCTCEYICGKKMDIFNYIEPPQESQEIYDIMVNNEEYDDEYLSE